MAAKYKAISLPEAKPAPIVEPIKVQAIFRFLNLSTIYNIERALKLCLNGILWPHAVSKSFFDYFFQKSHA